MIVSKILTITFIITFSVWMIVFGKFIYGKISKEKDEIELLVMSNWLLVMAIVMLGITIFSNIARKN